MIMIKIYALQIYINLRLKSLKTLWNFSKAKSREKINFTYVCTLFAFVLISIYLLCSLIMLMYAFLTWTLNVISWICSNLYVIIMYNMYFSIHNYASFEKIFICILCTLHLTVASFLSIFSPFPKKSASSSSPTHGRRSSNESNEVSCLEFFELSAIYPLQKRYAEKLT